MAARSSRNWALKSALSLIILSHLCCAAIGAAGGHVKRETINEEARSQLAARLPHKRAALATLTSAGGLLEADVRVAPANRSGERAAVLSQHENGLQQNSSTTGARPLQVQVTAIHVDRSEFALSELLFRLTLRLALSEARRLLVPEEPQQQQQQQQQQRNATHLQERRQIKRRVWLKLSVRSASTCSRQQAAALAAEEFYLRRSRLFLVSGCDEAIRSVSRLASHWRVPVMTAAGFGADLNDKSVHRTLIRVAFSLRAAVEFLFKLIKSFQWRRVNLLVDESDANSLALRGSIEQHAARAGAFSNSSSNNNNNNTSEQLQVGFNTISFDLQMLLRNNRAAGESDDELESVLAAGANSSADSSGRPPSGRLAGELLADDDRWPNELTERAIREALWQCSTYSRVTILLLPQQFVRKLMLSVYDQDMANGLYTFINIPLLAQETSASTSASGASSSSSAPGEPLAFEATGESGFLWRAASSRRNAHAKQAFESLMSIYLRTPTTKAYVYFSSKLTELANSQLAVASAHRRARNQTSTPSAHKRLQLNINPYSASFYDGLQIYASALSESLNQLGVARAATGRGFEGSVANASSSSSSSLEVEQQLHSRVSELVRNRRFENMVTGNIYINANGDRETDYTLDDMNQMTGKFGPVILYRGETRDIERLARIHWSSDASVGPTSDSVDCALLGTCVSRPMTRFTLLLMLLAGPLVLLLAAAFYFVHSKLSLESQLVDYWWKIHLSDIELVATRRKNANDGSLVIQQLQQQQQPPPPPPFGEAAESGVSSSARLQAAGSKGSAIKLAKNRLGARRRSIGANSAIGIDATLANNCDKTEITKATDVSATWNSTVMDVCYGNITLAMHKLAKVALRPLAKFHQSRKLMIELRSLKEISHNNLCRFVGILVDEGSLAIVSEFCPKGSLREFFHNESMVIDWTFKYSIINDIIAGLTYLHSSPLGFHGRLKSSNCLVSARFVVKLSDYGPHSLYEQLDEELERGSSEWLRGRLWLAPEHMKPALGRLGSMRGDVYSFGLLLYEIITNTLPFFDARRDQFLLPLKQLYQELKSGRAPELMQPAIESILEADANEIRAPPNGPAEDGGLQPARASIRPLVELMQTCWRPEVAKRPSSAAINGALKRITRGVTAKKLLENLTGRMEQYTNNLESLVEAKLACLLEEKERAEELLYQFVPKSIASLLKEGQFVQPEAFECVTVFYSDIVGFTSLSSESTPMQVVDFLSDLYLCFDSTLEQHDIFKVDTIGDAYIVASGLPQRNEGKHVIEIACAALELRDRLQAFRIPHKPHRQLQMRVGIHSGACIAGIVGGLHMPKYCVFGDTLTTGKFMESSGLPMKIHITQESRDLLAKLAEFAIEPRQPKITRDGLPIQTYWLERAAPL